MSKLSENAETPDLIIEILPDPRHKRWRVVVDGFEIAFHKSSWECDLFAKHLADFMRKFTSRAVMVERYPGLRPKA